MSHNSTPPSPPRGVCFIAFIFICVLLAWFRLLTLSHKVPNFLYVAGHHCRAWDLRQSHTTKWLLWNTFLQTHSLQKNHAEQNWAAAPPNSTVSGHTCKHPRQVPIAGMAWVPAASSVLRQRALRAVDTVGEQHREAPLWLVAPLSRSICKSGISGGSRWGLFGSSARSVNFGNTDLSELGQI